MNLDFPNTNLKATNNVLQFRRQEQLIEFGDFFQPTTLFHTIWQVSQSFLPMIKCPPLIIFENFFTKSKFFLQKEFSSKFFLFRFNSCFCQRALLRGVDDSWSGPSGRATEAQKKINISKNTEKGQLKCEISIVRSSIFQISPITLLSMKFHH